LHGSRAVKGEAFDRKSLERDKDEGGEELSCHSGIDARGSMYARQKGQFIATAEWEAAKSWNMRGIEIREGYGEGIAGLSNIPPVDHLLLCLLSPSGPKSGHFV